ncbi:MAG: energy transducer TonB [Acidobacteria bacterium]|nr:energy transducer TonB [Acidobacteriota bacterium]
MTTTEADELELHLLLPEWDEPTRRREAALASALLHVAILFALLVYGKMFPAPKDSRPRRSLQHISLFLPPPQELTQKEPNRGPRSKLFVAPDVARPPKLVVPKALSDVPPPQLSKGDLAREERPPQLVPKPEPAGTVLAQVIPPPPPPSPPKLVLEDANKPPGGRLGEPKVGVLAQQRPGSVIEGAVRDLSHGAGQGGTGVGDGFGGGTPEGFTLPSRGSAGSNLELLSDPMGVDFKPYLTRILATVRRNWYAVIPESARLGMVRGRVAIQFIIVRQGSVSKLVISSASGYEALDRAAVAGISASHPFPPLPAEFRGDNVRLQFTFLYNIPVR